MNVVKHSDIGTFKAWITKRGFRIMGVAVFLSAAAGVTGYLSIIPAKHYVQINLASDVAGIATTVDSSLVNPWGMAKSPSSAWWVACNGRGTVTIYTGEGLAYPTLNPLIVTVPPPAGTLGIPSSPTGVVFNGSADFTVDIGKPARYLFVTEDGTLSGWNPEVDKYDAVLAADNSSQAVYKGAALGRMNGKNYLYAANFLAGTVDVFDADFHQVQLAPDAFIDALLPEDFAPFNVQNIGGSIYVTYAKQDPDGFDPIPGVGLGFVTVFESGGKLIMRLQSGWWMNAPWGMALAPEDFGKYGGRLLVGNTGSGTIAAFDADTGDFKGLLEGPEGQPVAIEGLHGIGFGNDNLAGPSAVLFFTAGMGSAEHGLFGSVRPAQ